jgi:glycosyltransferase involved in cell wall biosynthesis
LSTDSHFISVLIPTLGRDSLDRCLAAVAAQTRPADEVVTVVDRERRGPSWARNEGLRRTRGDLIAFTDDDCLPPPEWLASLVAALDRYGAAGAGGSVLETDPLLQAARRRRRLPDAVTSDPGGLVGVSANIVYCRDVLEAVAERDGFVFNESFPGSGEDWELNARLAMLGARFVYVPVQVKHLRSAGRLRSYLHWQFGRGKGIAHLHRSIRQRRLRVRLQRSRLWDNDRTLVQRILAIVVDKLLGPFDRAGFPSLRLFGWYWLGMKAQSAGFVWGWVVLRLGGVGRARRQSLTP